MSKEKKTNAMRILDSAKIPYQIHTYDVSDGILDGVSVAKKCNGNPRLVYKTLVTTGSDKNHYVFVIPVETTLDLKRAAKAVGVKAIAMLAQKELLPLTGYIHGGCSPIGMKKQFMTVYDENINTIETILVSAGKVGTQVELKPSDLIDITQGKIASITG